MRIVGQIIFSVSVLVILSLLNFVLFKYFNKDWWQRRIVRKINLIIPGIGFIGVTIWFIGNYTNSITLSAFGSVLTVVVVIILLSLIISLPFSAVFNKLSRRRGKKELTKKENKEKIDNSRRRILKGTAAALPLITLSAAGGGIARSFLDTDVYVLPLEFKNLPLHLEGLRILHLTDSHLGIYKHLDDYENILIEAEKYRPDIVLMTGDIADDLDLLPEVLKLADGFNSKYGTYASLGNHEYYRGINRVLRTFDSGPVELLRSNGKTLDINGGQLYLAGSDDPVTMRQVKYGFLIESMNKALAGRKDGVFTVLMTHRPEGFDPAAEIGIELTLSGHTHGGQAGLNGHSLWSVFTDRYLWGKYAKNGSQMYLSSGIGHWFPFRLGCPTEAPIIELTSKIDS